jgi:hypothetical protein
MMEVSELGVCLRLTGLVDDIAVVQVQLQHAHTLRRGDGAHIEVPDSMPVDRCRGKAWSLFRGDEFIDIDRMNGPLAMLIATPVAQGIPDSRATGRKDVSHHCHLSHGDDAAGYQQSPAQIPALQPCPTSKMPAALIVRCPSAPTSGMIRWRLYQAIISPRGGVFSSIGLRGVSHQCSAAFRDVLPRLGG